jgi:hypothetical protein
VGDNAAPPLAGSLDFGIWIRDAGWSRLGGTHRITIKFTLSLTKGLDSEFVMGERFVETKIKESSKGFEGRSVSTNRSHF